MGPGLRRDDGLEFSGKTAAASGHWLKTAWRKSVYIVKCETITPMKIGMMAWYWRGNSGNFWPLPQSPADAATVMMCN
jgi:hypothetical protein